MKRVNLFIPLFLAAIFFVSTGSAQSNAYLKMDGIDGEATDAKHRDWINIESYSQGLTKPPGGGATGAGRRRSSVVVEDFSFTKKLDKSSPKLMEYAVKGQVIPQVVLEVTNSSKNPLYKITLTNVIISSVNNSGACTPQCEILEQVSLNFERVTWEYTDAKGGKVISSYIPEKGI